MLIGASGAALLTAGCGEKEGEKLVNKTAGDGPPKGLVAPSGALGANFNEDPSDMKFSHLEGLSAGWLRGFIPMQEADDHDQVKDQAAVSTLLTAAGKGYGTSMSLKFQYKDQDLPRVGSTLMKTELARAEKVARAVMNHVDILVIGNEPFLETKHAERDDPAVINAFYEHLARHLIAYRKKHFGARCKTRLYMGAINHLDNPKRRTPATKKWMEFVRDTPEIEGVDIHPHVASLDDSKKYLNYILPYIEEGDKKFLATEFSLVIHWEDHMTDKIPAKFADDYGMDPEMRVWQFLKAAVDNPMPQKKWDDFLSMSPWFNSNRHYLRDQVKQFRDTGRLALATYGVVQADAMVEKISPTKKPWMLNSLYATRTVQEHKDGTAGRTQAWFDDFRALQRPRDHKPVRTGETAT